MDRRQFLAAATLPLPYLQAARPRWRAAIIGHTGRGNYGHDVDLGLPGDAASKALFEFALRLR